MSLLSPLFLLGLLGLLLPWLMHRFSHHEPPEQAFPSTRFLEATKPPATSKRKIRHWLLLLCRWLLLGLLCLLFAEPWFRSPSGSANADSTHFVVIDSSYSMRASNRWQAANQQFDELVGGLPDSDAVQVFSFSNKLVALTNPDDARATAAASIDLLEPGFAASDYGALMSQLNKLAADSDKPVTATFITDAQASNLPLKMNSLLANRLQQFNVEQIPGTDDINYFLSAKARTDDAVTARGTVRVAASGKQTDNATTLSGSDASTDIAPVSKTVHVSIKDKIVATDAVNIRAGEATTIQFDGLNLPASASDILSVSFAQQDFLPDDDTVAVPVLGSAALDIAITYIGTEPSQQARVFVQTAMETDGLAKIAALDENAALSPSSRHAVVFIDDLANIPTAVERYVFDGGNVLLIPSTAVDTQDSAPSLSGTTVADIDLAHPMALGDFNWFEASFYNVAPFSSKTDDRNVLTLNSGEPLLVERSIADSGQLLLLNDSLDGYDSDLPLQPAFVSLMQRIVEYFDASSAIPVQVEAGSSVSLPAKVQLIDPSGEELLDLAQLSSSNNVQVSSPGVYSVLAANQSNPIAVVIDGRESNLHAMAEDDIVSWEQRNTPIAQNNENTSDSETSQISQIADKVAKPPADASTLWRWLLPMLALVLVVESIYANRMLWVRRDGL